MKFKVYFEFFKEKKQCTIECNNQSEIFNKLSDKILIHKIEKIEDESLNNNILNNMKSMFGFD